MQAVQEGQASPICQRAPQLAPLRAIQALSPPRRSLPRPKFDRSICRPDETILERRLNPFPRPLPRSYRSMAGSTFFHAGLPLRGNSSAVASVAPYTIYLRSASPPATTAIPRGATAFATPAALLCFVWKTSRLTSKVVEFPRVLPLRLEIRQTSPKAAAAIDHRLFQGVEALQRCGPCRAAAVYGVLPQHPRHAVWLHAQSA